MTLLPKRSLILGLQRYAFIHNLKINLKKYFIAFLRASHITIHKQKVVKCIVNYNIIPHTFTKTINHCT